MSVFVDVCALWDYRREMQEMCMPPVLMCQGKFAQKLQGAGLEERTAGHVAPMHVCITLLSY